jgi:hypothetical protein
VERVKTILRRCDNGASRETHDQNALPQVIDDAGVAAAVGIRVQQVMQVWTSGHQINRKPQAQHHAESDASPNPAMRW